MVTESAFFSSLEVIFHFPSPENIVINLGIDKQQKALNVVCRKKCDFRAESVD